MGTIRLGVGTEWLLDGRGFRIVRQLGPDQFVVLDTKFQVEQVVSTSQILSHFTSGELRFATDSLPTQSPVPINDTCPTSHEMSATSIPEQLQPTLPTTVHDLTDDERQQLERRWHAIDPLTRLGRKPTADEFQTRVRELTTAGQPCSLRTLRRLFARWQHGHKDRLALLPRTHDRGGRGHSRPHGLLKRCPIIGQLVERAINDVFLTMARRPISAVVRRVIEDLQRHNARLPPTHAVPIPRKFALARSISRQIGRLDPWEVDRARWGRHIADRRHSPTSPQRMATRILERVEIDHTPLKVVVGTDAGPLGQPWLTVLVDYYSRMIVGFCIGFEPPSYAVIMEALRHAILPKSYVRERYPRIANDWPCFGIPSKLVCDRGSDLTSKDLEKAAFQLGIELDFTPPRTPNFKGTVESFFDTLNDQLLSSLPGRTFRSWERRADYNPDDGPLLPYATLVEIIHLHLIDVHAQQRHPAATKSRLAMWQESAAEFPPALPTSPDELLVLLSKTVERSLSARGLELTGMFYTSNDLMALRTELAANNIASDRLTVRYNPWDLGSVWVLNPIDRRYIKAAAVDSAVVGMTEYQWRVLRRAVREQFDAPEQVLSLATARNSIRDLVEQAVNKRTKKRRVRAARFSGDFQSNSLGEDDRANRRSDTMSGFLEDTAVGLPCHESPCREDVAPDPSLPPPLEADDSPDELDVDDWDVAV
ncbi:MAG: DDE-type integrase/transposase/recombinase [Planctomycetales bacterium]|nr:DDE-type integrase/transposase/recombinase [Planctomycetales bacterium]